MSTRNNDGAPVASPLATNTAPQQTEALPKPPMLWLLIPLALLALLAFLSRS